MRRFRWGSVAGIRAAPDIAFGLVAGVYELYECVLDDNSLVDLALFVLRLLLTAAICGFVWAVIKPATQSTRIARAALLVACPLIVLVVMRGAGL